MKKLLERLTQWIQDQIDRMPWRQAPAPEQDALPENPTDIPETTPGSNNQNAYFHYKTYDGTFRIRWPSYFAGQIGDAAESWTMVDGHRARFRSWDRDHGARRPSYTLQGSKGMFSGEVTCVLHAADGRALAWFRADSQGRFQGRIP